MLFGIPRFAQKGEYLPQANKLVDGDEEDWNLGERFFEEKHVFEWWYSRVEGSAVERREVQFEHTGLKKSCSITVIKPWGIGSKFTGAEDWAVKFNTGLDCFLGVKPSMRQVRWD